jgi:hypothetical protein
LVVVEPVLDHAAAERARLVNRNRAELLRSGRAVTLDLLAEGQDKNLEAARQWARRQRRAGRFVYVVHNGATYVPTFQLDEAFDLHPVAAEVVAELVARGFSDWAVWTWFESRSPWLGKQTPAEASRTGDRDGLRRALDGLFQE